MLGINLWAVLPALVFVTVALLGLFSRPRRSWPVRWLRTAGVLAMLSALWSAALREPLALGVSLAAASLSFGALAIAAAWRADL